MHAGLKKKRLTPNPKQNHLILTRKYLDPRHHDGDDDPRPQIEVDARQSLYIYKLRRKSSRRSEQRTRPFPVVRCWGGVEVSL